MYTIAVRCSGAPARAAALLAARGRRAALAEHLRIAHVYDVIINYVCIYIYIYIHVYIYIYIYIYTISRPRGDRKFGCCFCRAPSYSRSSADVVVVVVVVVVVIQVIVVIIVMTNINNNHNNEYNSNNIITELTQ